MRLGVYLCSERRLDTAGLGRLAGALALAPEPAPWGVLPESCVVAEPAGGFIALTRTRVRRSDRLRVERATQALRRLVDAATREGRAALLVYRIGDEEKTPVEATVACASYFGDDGAWLASALERPTLYWIGAPVARAEELNQ